VRIFQPRFTGEVRLVIWSFLKTAELAANTMGRRADQVLTRDSRETRVLSGAAA
jgi:hypothetical protein